MSVNLTPKPYKYFIIYNNGVDELELTTDPKGWQEHSIGFSRGEDFGNNVEIVVPLSFSGAGSTLLRALYEGTGVFTKANIRIEKRENDWSMSEFYVYRLDFSTYKDTLRFIEISGIEDGLLSKFQAYKDTEYEISLPTSNKEFLDYTGVSVTKKNLIQCLYGSIQAYEKEDIGEDVYLLKGSRAVRTYNDSLVFTDPNGEPFQTMTFRCVKAVSFTANVVLKLKVTANGTLFNPASGKIKIVKHNLSYGSPTIIATYTPTYTRVSSSKRIDTFTISATQSFALVAGDYISIAYYAESPKTYDDISVDDAFDAYFEISNLAASAYIAQKVEVFSYEWLIGQLLIKIGGGVTPAFYCGITYSDFKPMLSATPCIRNMGSLVGTGKLKVSLSDVLKSFNCLHKIGIDISGNTFTINSRNAFYLNESAGLIIANNIVLSHDETSQFNKISVGYNVDKQKEDSDLVYPFNCKKEFEILNSQSKNEIDLVNPFKGDCYDIDNYITDTLASSDNSDTCDFVIFATIPILGNTDSAGGAEATQVLDNSDSQPMQTQVWVTYQIPDVIRKYDSRIKVYAATSTDDNFTPIGFIIEVREQGILVETFSGSTVPNPLGYTTASEIQANANIDITYIQNYEIAEFTTSTFMSVSSESYFVYSSAKEIGKEVYREHTITGFDGNPSTVYNVPITPKRILQKHLDYLSISNYGNSSDISFVNTDFVSAITSECGFETAEVIENADLSDVAPPFLPTTIECEVTNLFDSITDLSSNKYKYYQIQDEKSAKIYEGWINIVTFAPTKNKPQNLVLQAKKI